VGVGDEFPAKEVRNEPPEEEPVVHHHHYYRGRDRYAAIDTAAAGCGSCCGSW
jgi:hypothetical protein